MKLVATAAAALADLGVEEPGAHLALIRSWNTTTLLITREPITRQQLAAIREFARSRSFDTAWLPGIREAETNRFNVLERPYLYEAATALLGADAQVFADRYKFYIAPATDDRPYFFHFFKWRTLPEVFALRRVGGAGLIEWGYLVLVATLVQALLAGAALVLLPLSTAPRDWPPGTAKRMGSYFLLLGLAFLFVEMAFIQKFILFLSHPLYAVAVVLCGFLVFAGIGSACSAGYARRVRERGWSPVGVAALYIAILSLAYVALLPWIFDRFIGYPDPVRVGVAFLLIAPLAAGMGIPFPLGLSFTAERAPAFVPWAWGINGFASVVSAVLATLLAIEFGFGVVIVLALLMYIAASRLMAH